MQYQMNTLLKLSCIHLPANYTPHIISETLLVPSGSLHCSLAIFWAMPEGNKELESNLCFSDMRAQALSVCEGAVASLRYPVPLADPQGTCPVVLQAWIELLPGLLLWEQGMGKTLTHQHQEQAGQTNLFQALYSRRKQAKAGRTALTQLDVAISWEALSTFPRNNKSVQFTLKSIYARS